MKRIILSSLLALTVAVTTLAQQFAVIETPDGQTFIPVEDIKSITYESDPSFPERLLPAVLSHDSRIQIFSQALRATGLADSLTAYFDPAYSAEGIRGGYLVMRAYPGRSMAFIENLPVVRKRLFTVFVETDSVLAAHGIRNLDDLKRYASSIYDEVYPNDAAVPDPTDRRNALNRFVAYHLLPFGSDDSTLTADPTFFIRDIADVSDWYETLMPGACLKCSRPDGSEAGLYLNRRGVQDRADKYGMKIRGAKIIPGADGTLTQKAFNGAYFYIDDLLTYGTQTQTQVLNERWRIDMVTLSPDIMNNMTRKNIEYNNSDCAIYTVLLPSNHQNIQISDNCSALVVSPYNYVMWDYGGDELMVATEDYNFEVAMKLPPLPEGDWELRYGMCFPLAGLLAKVVFRINDVAVGDTLVAEEYVGEKAESNIERFGWRDGLPADEQAAANRELRSHGWMKAPAEYATSTTCENYRSDENSLAMSHQKELLRRIVGRVHSDGQTPIWLTVQMITYGEMYHWKYRPVQFDYIECCPTWIADSEEIPED